MKSQVSLKSILGATTEGMIHHVKRCLQDTSPPNTIILHHGTNDLKSKSTPEQITDNQRGTRSNVVGKFGEFYDKKTKYRILSISSPAKINDGF